MLRALAAITAVSALSASAQVAVYTGPDAGLSFGAGAQPLVFLKDRYLLFFTQGSQLAYAESRDGLSFGPPVVLPGIIASEGYGAAVMGDKLGLAWGTLSGATYTLNYAEVVDSGGTLSLVPQVVSSSTDPWGLKPTLAFTTAGEPVIVAFDYAHHYAGPLNGCGPTPRYRPAPYYRRAAGWEYVGYCNAFRSVPPATGSNAVAVLNSGKVLFGSTAPAETSFNTGILDPSLPPDAGELGEPWTLQPDPNVTDGDALALVKSVSAPDDGHYVYVSLSGRIRYTRQDALQTASSTSGLDLTDIAMTGTSPNIFEPAASSGCYVIAWLEGAHVQMRTFVGSIATLSASQTLFVRPAPARRLSLVRRGDNPAIAWLEGDTVYFATIQPAPVVSAVPSATPSDGQTVITVSVSGALDACGKPLAQGTALTVTVTSGAILTIDASPLPGQQVLIDASGGATFTVQAPLVQGASTIRVVPSSGGTPGTAQVTFTAVDAGSAQDAGADGGAAVDAGSGVVDGGSDAGAQTDSGTADGGVQVDGGPPDGAAGPDGGNPRSTARYGVGCNCAEIGVGPLWGLLLLLPGRSGRRRGLKPVEQEHRG